MLHAGLDLSRRRLDVCLVNDAGEVLAQTAAAPDADGLRHLIGRVNAPRVRAVIESMTGARFVHDTLEEHGWDVLVADAQKVRSRRSDRGDGARPMARSPPFGCGRRPTASWTRNQRRFCATRSSAARQPKARL
jgi:transposase